ncbi:MAG: hypothetical protein P8X42_11705 [Calditrichaceae bacterium]
MDEKLRDKLAQTYRINKVLWFAILADVIILAVIAFALEYFKVLTTPALHSFKTFNDISLIIVIVLLFAIMYMKRSFLFPSKIVQKAKNSDLPMDESGMADVWDEFGEEGKLLFRVLMLLRRYFMIIWSFANLIVILGFILYILSLNLNNFLIYGVVGLYSLVINFPRFTIIENCYYQIKNE